jgi:threonine/homoserine/homoserine lactone efflux protein
MLFTLIGLSALLPQELNRRGRQKRIVTAIGVAMGTHIGLIFLINIHGRWSLTIPLAYLAILLIGLTCLVILENQNIRAWWHQRSVEKIGENAYL